MVIIPSAVDARPELYASIHGIVKAIINSRVMSCDSVEDEAVFGLNSDHPAPKGVVFLNRSQQISSEKQVHYFSFLPSKLFLKEISPNFISPNLTFVNWGIDSSLTTAEMAPKKQIHINFFEMCITGAHMGVGQWK